MTLRMDSRQQLDLSGTWQIAFDPNNEGLKTNWVNGKFPHERAKPVLVPRIWNVDFPNAEGVGFYRTAFASPSHWKDRAVYLRFDGASYTAGVWINGAYVASHEGAYTPFEYDVTPFIRPDAENELIVRVAALSRTKPVDGMILQHSPASKQSWYYVYGGLWGKVYLEVRARVSHQSVSIEPDLKRETVRIDVALRNQHTEFRPIDLRLKITAPDNNVVFDQSNRVSLLPGLSRYSYTVPLPRPQPWSCAIPNLYHLQTEARTADGECDSQTTPFGMRDFTVRDGEYFLNGEPIFIRGVILQPNYPINLVTPPDDEMMAREVRLVKDAGFNLIRTHLRPAPPGYLDLTDQLGLLVYAETSLAWIKDNPRLLDHGRREVRALIERDRNHPSVVIWGIFNENPSASALASDVLVPFARALDPTRVVVDDSGGSIAIDQDFGWIDRATVVPSRETERQRILDVHLYLGGYYSQPLYEWVRKLGTGVSSRVLAEHEFGSFPVLEEFDREQRANQGKIFVSELGYGGMSSLDESVARFGGREDLLDARELVILRDGLHAGFQARHLERILGSVDNLYRAAQEIHAGADKRQIEAVICNPRVSGYVVTQLNDVAWEFHAGILDLWRNPKLAYHAVKQLNRPHCVVMKAMSPVASFGDRINVALRLVDQSPLQGTEQVAWTVFDPAGKEIATDLRQAPIGTGIKEIGDISFDAKNMPGSYRVSARLMKNGELLTESAETILVLPPVDWSGLPKDIDWLGASFDQMETARPGDSPMQTRLSVATQPGLLTDEDWQSLLDRVEAGQVAIIGALHKRNERALHALAQRGIEVQLNFGIGSWMGCYHWIPSSPLFAGLPAGGLGGEEYVDVLPWYVMSEHGGDVWAGSLHNTQTRKEPCMMLWFSDIEAIRLGAGLIVLCQYRIFDKLKTNPLAARLAFNLIQQAHGYSPDDQRTP